MGIPLRNLRVSAHRYNLTRESVEEDGVDMTVEEIIVHPSFDFRTLANDIAVWRLKGGESLNTTVRLDNGVNSYPGRKCTVIGWGNTNERGSPSEVLLEVDVPIIDYEKCNRRFNGVLSDSMLCAGGEENEDACQGGMIRVL